MFACAAGHSSFIANPHESPSTQVVVAMKLFGYYPSSLTRYCNAALVDIVPNEYSLTAVDGCRTCSYGVRLRVPRFISVASQETF